MREKKTIIITSGGMPVPAVQGGAVQNLVEHLVAENEIEQKMELFIVGPYDEEADQASKKYVTTKFLWVKIPFFVCLLDKLTYEIVKRFLKKKKSLSARKIWQTLWYTYNCALILRKADYDKVVIENGIIICWCLKLFRNYKKYQGKYYLHYHNVPRFDGKCKDVIQRANKILCVSSFVAGEIQKSDNPIGPIAKERTCVCYNGIDIQKFSPKISTDGFKLLKEKYHLSNNQKVILFTGRLSIEKGIYELIRVLDYLKYKDYKLLIVGASFYGLNIKEEFEKSLKALALKHKDKIVFTGYIDYNEMPKLYQIADIVVLPSMWEEPAGLTIIEAMACGKIVITTRSGGILEYSGNKAAVVIERDENLICEIAMKIDEVFNDGITLEQQPRDRAKLFSKRIYYENFIQSIGIK